MPAALQRTKIEFTSGQDTCAAWYYPAANRACIVMAGGFGVTKEAGTDRFARRFHEAGFGVLAFDFRHQGESGGMPRQVARITDQIEDWQAAIAFAASRPGIDADRIAGWSFSLTGGLLIDVAGRVAASADTTGTSGLAAVIAQCPNADGPATTRNARRFQSSGAMMRFTARAIRDTVGRRFGRPPILIPLVAQRGTVALLTTPDAQVGADALQAADHPEWPQTIAAASGLRAAFYRSGRRAHRVRCPLLVVVSEQDQTALAQPAIDAARRAPRGELVSVPGGHYAPFLAQHETVVAAELSFLHRHLLDAADSVHADSD